MAGASALANDTTAELAAGGLEFVRNPIVEMRSEQLFVSPAQVRVTYRFFNTSDQPVTNLVAFPMPDITVDNPDWNVVVPTEDPVNFLGLFDPGGRSAGRHPGGAEGVRHGCRSHRDVAAARLAVGAAVEGDV